MKLSVLSVCALAGVAGLAASASAQWSTGFEAPTFVAGPIEPQNGWSATGTNLPAFAISTANPFAGTQHLRYARNPGGLNGSQHLIFSPVVPMAATNDTVTSVMLNISNFGGADYDVIAQSPAQALTSWRVNFSFADNPVAPTGPGNIFVLDDDDVNPVTPLVFVDTGVTWTVGQYEELRVEMNNAADTIDYYYGGVLIYSGVIYGGTVPDQLVLRHDNWQIGDFMDVDNIGVSVVPTPGAAALLGLGALAIGRRRR